MTTFLTPIVRLILIACAALFTGCSLLPISETPAPPPPATTPPPNTEPAKPQAQNRSNATTALDYRHDVATHLYAQNTDRIYTGKLPPLLYAVGVLETDIDVRGMVSAVRWLRAPTHAPEVMAEIERTVRAAAPYPAPARLGRVTTTETWLWHKSGKFQLHTLSEGQL